MRKHDVLIIGSGLAGLATAARLAELGHKDIAIYSPGAGGTPLIAAINFVLPNNPYGDTVELYASDMLEAGYQVGNPTLVREMTEKTLEGYQLLKRYGVEFSLLEDGSPRIRHVSGHTHPRSLCNTQELIGLTIRRALRKGLKEKGVLLVDNVECLDLLYEGNQVRGALFQLAHGQAEPVLAPIVVAGWGGVGNLLGESTYPYDVQGNTLGMAAMADVDLVDLEFLEYEPMVVMAPATAKGEPCPTAMLGEGGHLLNTKGERFLLKVRPQGEAGASKTLINQQIWQQVKAGNGTDKGGVYVDLRHIPAQVLQGYPWFLNRLLAGGLDPNQSLVEVAPMAHSFSGGIRVGSDYQSSMRGLYAVGEACGGIHGACRCAGNAGSQALLSGLICAESIADAQPVPVETAPVADYHADKEVRETLGEQARLIAAEALGITRDGNTLEKARQQLTTLLADPAAKKDTRTLQSITAMLRMVEAALARKESRGAHHRVDA